MSRIASTLAVITWLLLLGQSSDAQSVQQSGAVTPGHIATFATSGVIQDGGGVITNYNAAGASATSIAGGSTYWCSPSGCSTSPAIATIATTPVVLQNLLFNVNTAPGSGFQVGIVLYAGPYGALVNTAANCTIENAATICGDSSHQVQINAGEAWALEVIVEAGATSTGGESFSFQASAQALPPPSLPSVLQNGVITSGHIAEWITNGVIGDGGAAVNTPGTLPLITVCPAVPPLTFPQFVYNTTGGPAAAQVGIWDGTHCDYFLAIDQTTGSVTGTFNAVTVGDVPAYQIVGSLSALSALPIAGVPSGYGVQQLGYYAAGDGGQTIRIPETGSCAANGRTNDGGSCSNNIADSNSYYAAAPNVAFDVRQFGAKGDLATFSGGEATASSTTFTRTDGANFNASADAAKTIIIIGAGAGGLPLSTTFASAPNGTTATLTTAATYAASSSTYSLCYVYNQCSAVAPVTKQSGAGSYAPGDTVTATGGTCAAEPTLSVAHTTVISATVNAAGTGGTTSSSAEVWGTTGTGMVFRALVTISGGGITAVNSIFFGGDYTANPTTLTNEPVVGAGLSGASLSVKMGVLIAIIDTPGNCTTAPSNPVAQGSTSGSGTGATFDLYWAANGAWYYGTDDTAAIQAAVNAIAQNGSASALVGPNGACLYFPYGWYLFSSTITAAGSNFCLTGIAPNGPQAALFFNDSAGTHDAIAMSGGKGVVQIQNLWIDSLVPATAGALVHLTDAYYVRIINDTLGNSGNAWDLVRLECAASNPGEERIVDSQLTNGRHIGAHIRCENNSYAISDTYVERRNFITGNMFAGIAFFGNIDGAYVTNSSMYNNGYGVYGDALTYTNPGFDSVTFLGAELDTNRILNAYLNQLNGSQLRFGHSFNAAIVCASCTSTTAGNTNYEGTNGYAVLEGAFDFSTIGDSFGGAGTAWYVGPNAAGTASSLISLTGEVIQGNGPFVNFMGATNPTNQITISAQGGSSLTCNSGSNFTQSVNPTASVLLCNGVYYNAIVSEGGLAAVTVGDRTASGQGTFYRTGGVNYLYDSTFGNMIGFGNSAGVNLYAPTTIATSVTVPTVYGGTAAGATLALASTSNGSPSGDSITLAASSIDIGTNSTDYVKVAGGASGASVTTNGGTLALGANGNNTLVFSSTGVPTFSSAPLVPGYAIASLPTCNSAAEGAHAYVTNGQSSPSYLGTVSTTGSVVAPVFCNGSAWVYG